MSEIKPVAFANPNEMPNRHYPWFETELHRKRAKPYTLELFTADQLAEAVAAERGRCAKVCEAIIEAIWHEKGSSPEPETGGVSLGETDHEIVVNLEEAAEAIRSAAK